MAQNWCFTLKFDRSVIAASHYCKLPQGLRKLERVSSLDNFMSSKQLGAKLSMAAKSRPTSPSQP